LFQPTFLMAATTARFRSKGEEACAGRRLCSRVDPAVEHGDPFFRNPSSERTPARTGTRGSGELSLPPLKRGSVAQWGTPEVPAGLAQKNSFEF
jgi:hypothetical protein